MKITRFNFTRKAVTFGVVIFLAIALVASGFAAWLISGASEETSEGTVGVVTVSNANLVIHVTDLVEGKLQSDDNKYKVQFGPDKNDKSGYITYTSGDADDARYENLGFNVTGTIDNGDKVGELTFAIRVSDALAYAAGLRKADSASDTDPFIYYEEAKAYITLPACALDVNGNALPMPTDSSTKTNVDGKPGFVTLNTTTAPVSLTIASELNSTGITENGFNYAFVDSKYAFTAPYQFGWGPAVNNDNPGYTLDKKDVEKEGNSYPALPSIVYPNGNSANAYSPAQAELVLRLINVIVCNKKITSAMTYDGTNAITTATSINPWELDVTNLPDTITGSTQAEKVSNLNAALELLESADDLKSITAPYIVYISALPR